MPLRALTTELIEQYKAAGWWQSRTLFEVVEDHALRTPDKLAVSDLSVELTYAELVSQARSLGAWLVANGLQPGDTVALQTPNSILLPLTHLAAGAAGLLFMPMSDAWREKEIGHLLSLADAKAVIVPASEEPHDFVRMVEELRDRLPGLQTLLTDVPREGFESVSEIVGSYPPEQPEVVRDPNLPNYAMVSSGTTALPKVSLWSDNNLWAFLKYYADCIDLDEDDIAVGLAPANTGATGYVFPVLAPLLRGASSILQPRWDPTTAVELLATRATRATAVPTQIVKLLEEPGVDRATWTQLRTFTNAGAPLAPTKAKELEERLHCIVQTVYGASDGGVPVMTRLSDPPEKRYGTVGQIAPDTDLRLVDAYLADVPVGSKGEVVWRNHMKSFGYLNDPELTEAVWIDDGYYRSGDLGVLDADGYLSIVGRVKDMIIRGGQNLSPLEIELAVAKHPSVGEVAVVGLPDEVYGERACACVRLKEGSPSLSLEELVAFLKDEGMAKFKLPERLEVFDELPRSAGGKLSKVELREAIVRGSSDAQTTPVAH